MPTKGTLTDLAMFQTLEKQFGKRAGWGEPKHIGGGYLQAGCGKYRIEGTGQGGFSILLGPHVIEHSLPLGEAIRQAQKLAEEEPTVELPQPPAPNTIQVHQTPQPAGEEPVVELVVLGVPTEESGSVETRGSDA